MISLRAGSPLGLLVGASLAAACAAVALLHLDQLGFSVCALKAFTGIPCMTCGGTRAAACLGRLDPWGALAMNPLVALAAVLIATWALVDLALLPWRRTLTVELPPPSARWVRIMAGVAVALNWAYLVAAGR